MVLKFGSKGEAVKTLQYFLGINADGGFGKKTESAVRFFQNENGLLPDGVVGEKTWKAMGLASTDVSETSLTTKKGLLIKANYMDRDEYIQETTKKEFVFLHHTGGWNNPYDAISGWNNDNRGTIGTEFVIGGVNIKDGSEQYDGEVLQAFPEGYWAWHLGINGNVHKNSVGIELCNFGQLENGKTWSGAQAKSDQIYTLTKPFRGFKEFHIYSDHQIAQLKKLLLFIAERDNIDIRKGLPELIKKEGVKAFDFKETAFKGAVKGLWTHTNVRKDKLDCFPQPELIDMLLGL